MSSKPGRIGRLYRDRPGPLPALFAVLLGLVLIAMAAPRLVAGLLIAPHDELVRGLSRETIGKGPALAEASADYEAALTWDDEANSAAQLATLDYLLAQSVGFESEAGLTWLRRTLAAARRAVAGNPAQPYTWVQIALALERLKALKAQVQEHQAALGPVDERLQALLLQIPNPPDAEAPDVGLFVYSSLTVGATALWAGSGELVRGVLERTEPGHRIGLGSQEAIDQVTFVAGAGTSAARTSTSAVPEAIRLRP